jgi:hypothetical protein
MIGIAVLGVMTMKQIMGMEMYMGLIPMVMNMLVDKIDF